MQKVPKRANNAEYKNRLKKLIKKIKNIVKKV